MSTTPPNNPWGQPTPPTTPPADQWAQPSAAPAPELAQTDVMPAASGSGGTGKKPIAIVVGILAVIAVAVVGGLALFGGDDDGGGGRSAASDDPEEAVDIAEDAVQAVLDGDCDQAEELSTRGFRRQLDDLCGEPYPDSEITDSTLDNEDPVVVLVEFTVRDAELSYPLTMEYDDDEEMWFVDEINVAGGLPDDPTDDTEPTETGDPSGEGDPHDAVDAATGLVAALIEQDCDAAAEFATPEFAENELDTACDEDPGDIEITGASVVNEDPVVVEVEFDSSESGEGSLPLEMVYEGDEWLVADFYFEVAEPAEPRTIETIPVPDDSTDQPQASDDSAEAAVPVAQAAIEALAAGDCDTALSLATPTFVDLYGETICDELPPGTGVTGAALISEDPVVVSVDTDAGFGIELDMVYENGTWLVDDYSV